MSVKNKVILVGTYHKTGTVWMMQTFRAIARALDVSFFHKQREEDAGAVEPGIYFDPHSLFTLAQLEAADSGFRLIRDPRDVIVSGTFYHIRALEDWLKRPQERFAGKSYVEAITALPTQHDQFVFEMQHVARRTIAGMVGLWKVGRSAPYIRPVKYEDLITDYDTERFAELLRSLGFNEAEVEVGRDIFYKNSIFSGTKKNKVHIRSGKSRQWERYFTRDLAIEFKKRYRHSLIKLGYEADQKWSINLPENID